MMNATQLVRRNAVLPSKEICTSREGHAAGGGPVDRTHVTKNLRDRDVPSDFEQTVKTISLKSSFRSRYWSTAGRAVVFAASRSASIAFSKSSPSTP